MCEPSRGRLATTYAAHARSSSDTRSKASSSVAPTANAPWLAISTAGPCPSAPTVPSVIFFVPGRAYGAHGTSPNGVGTGTRAAAQIEAADLMGVHAGHHLRPAPVGLTVQLALAAGLVRPCPLTGVEVDAHDHLLGEVRVGDPAGRDEHRALVEAHAQVAPRARHQALGEQAVPGLDELAAGLRLAHGRAPSTWANTRSKAATAWSMVASVCAALV